MPARGRTFVFGAFVLANSCSRDRSASTLNRIQGVPSESVAPVPTTPPAPPPCPTDMAFVPGDGGKIASFCMEHTLVTARAYRKCVEAKACKKPVDNIASEYATYGAKGDDRLPINYVSQSMSRSYCEWHGRRLPNDLEFNWAIHSGPEKSRFPWGQEAPLGRVCAWSKNHALNQPCVVGAFSAGQSKQGIDDLEGNLMEWSGVVMPGSYHRSAYAQCITCCRYFGRPSDVIELGLTADYTNVLAGNEDVPCDDRGSSIGFRCVSEPLDGASVAASAKTP